MTSTKLACTFTVLAACIGSAAAQTTVTVYGRLDLSVRQLADAVKNKEVANGSTSRLGFRGTEDLGGGLAAFFDIQHRFAADTGVANPIFWEGRSIVGLQGGFGQVFLGRYESAAYQLVELPADPWGADYVTSNATIIRGGIGNNRLSNSINYRFTAGGLTFGAQFAEADDNVQNGAANDRPYSLAVAYAAGPLKVGVGYEDPPDADDDWTTVAGSYNLGFVTLGGLIGNGKNAANQKVDSYLVTAVAGMGGGELRASYGQRKNKATNLKLDKQFGIGYWYSLSKRTQIYANVVNEKRDQIPANFEKTGWDVGIYHNF